MVLIPQYERSEGLQPGRGASVNVDTSIGQGLAAVGGAIANFGDVLQQRQEKQNAFDDQIKLEQHRQQTEGAFREAQQNMPAGATGFTKTFLDARKQSDDDFLNSISPANRDRYAKMWELDREKVADSAAQVEYKARGDYETTQLNNALDTWQTRVRADPSQRQAATEDLSHLIDTSTSIDAATKEKFKRTIGGSLASAEWLSLYGSDPVAGRRALGLEPAVPVDEIRNAAAELGTTPEDLATVISYESNFDPSRWGGKGGQYLGLIQFGPEERQKYGVHPGQTFKEQMRSVVAFLKDRGFKPGMGLIDLYSTINAGQPGRYDASDGPGNTVASHVDAMRSGPAYQRAVEVLGGKTVPPGGDPRFADISYADRLRLIDQSQANYNSQIAESTRQQNQIIADTKGSYQLGIQTGDLRNEERILQEPNLRDADKAELISALRTRMKDENNLAVAQARYSSGDKFNPFVEDDRKQVDAVYQNMGGSAGLIDGDRASAQRLLDVVKQSGVVPKSAINAIQLSTNSTQPAQVAAGLTAATAIYRANPDGFRPYDGGQALAGDTETFRHLVYDRGMSATDAAQRIIDARDPERRRAEKDIAPDADKFVKDLTPNDVAGAFDLHPNVPFVGSVSPGADPSMVNAMMSDYREIARDKFVQYQDPDIAKSQAIAELKGLYGVTNVSGSPTLMKYPPEKYYPPIDGSTDYLRNAAVKDATDDALAAGRIVKPADIPAGAPIGTGGQLYGMVKDEAGSVSNVWLKASPETAEDIRNGRLPRYRLFYQTKENGQPIMHEVLGGLFQVTQDDVSAARGKELDGQRQDLQGDRATARGNAETLNRLQDGGDMFSDPKNYYGVPGAPDASQFTSDGHSSGALDAISGMAGPANSQWRSDVTPPEEKAVADDIARDKASLRDARLAKVQSGIKMLQQGMSPAQVDEQMRKAGIGQDLWSYAEPGDAPKTTRGIDAPDAPPAPEQVQAAAVSQTPARTTLQGGTGDTPPPEAAALSKDISAQKGELRDRRAAMVERGTKMLAAGVSPDAVDDQMRKAGIGQDLWSYKDPKGAPKTTQGFTERDRTAALSGGTGDSQPATPAPDVPTPRAKPEQPQTYTVQKGDTLTSIARRFYGAATPATIKKLQKANKIKNANRIAVGRVLTL